MTTKPKLTTAEELLAMPRNGDRYELIRGVLVQKMPAGDAHGDVVSKINYAWLITPTATIMEKSGPVNPATGWSGTQIRCALPMWPG